jgi:hypothetical protein
MKRAFPLAIIASIACSERPSRVYVAGESFRHGVHVTTAQGETARVKVGESLRLHASRRSGPWVEKAAKDVPDDGCWLSPPLDHEPEVAASLKWTADPQGAATFDIPSAAALNAGDFTRTVRFSRPGEYRLTGDSALACSRETSNAITVTVVAK